MPPSASSRRLAQPRGEARSASGAPRLAVRIGLEGGPAAVDRRRRGVQAKRRRSRRAFRLRPRPGAVLITSTVQRQVAGLFIVEDKGAYGFKGALAPMNLIASCG